MKTNKQTGFPFIRSIKITRWHTQFASEALNEFEIRDTPAQFITVHPYTS